MQPKIPQTNNILRTMFDLQEKLLVEYRKIENLPQAPVNLNEKQGQRLVKDFVRRGIEELAESYSTLLSLLNAAENNNPHLFENLLLDYNAEIADCLHFILELLIFSDITEAGIDLYFQKRSESKGQSSIYGTDSTLSGLLKLARYENSLNDINYDAIKKDASNFTLLDEVRAMTDRMYLQGGRKISIGLLRTHSIFLWEITYLFNIAVNHLKNKDWSQAERASNVLKYQEGIMEGFFHLVRYFEFLGYNMQGLYTVYFDKNVINQNRIKDGY